MADELLRHLAETPERAAVLLDVDGVLAPIVPHPKDARVPDETRRELVRLAARYRLVACVSGRPSSQVAELVGVEAVLADDLDPAGRPALSWAPRTQEPPP